MLLVFLLFLLLLQSLLLWQRVDLGQLSCNAASRCRKVPVERCWRRTSIDSAKGVCEHSQRRCVGLWSWSQGGSQWKNLFSTSLLQKTDQHLRGRRRRFQTKPGRGRSLGSIGGLPEEIKHTTFSLAVFAFPRAIGGRERGRETARKKSGSEVGGT